ncbi:MAG: permease-like cell division protein FtsX [Clostridia bacterium]|nr:permease-like cell division protein FtsX [Clostridia bacterium]
MKFSSVRYLIKDGFKGAWANRLMSLASIGVLIACMVIIGLAILISENVNMAIGNLEKENVVIVYMKDYNWALYGDELAVNDDTSSDVESGEDAENVEDTENETASDENAEETVDEKDVPDENGIKYSDYVIHNEQEAEKLRADIAALDNVAEAVYISSEEGLENAKAQMLGEQADYFTFLDDAYGNPMSAAVKVSMVDMSLFDETLEQIEKMNGVDTIQSYREIAQKINTLKQAIYVAGFWIIAILAIIALVIVSNTIRVTMYNRKLEISIMKAVGATDAFVRIPFVVEGLIIGLISALLSEVIIYFCYRVATEKIKDVLGSVISFREVSVYLLLVFIAIGIFAGIFGSFIMIRKYLKREGSEFTAI